VPLGQVLVAPDARRVVSVVVGAPCRRRRWGIVAGLGAGRRRLSAQLPVERVAVVPTADAAAEVVGRRGRPAAAAPHRVGVGSGGLPPQRVAAAAGVRLRRAALPAGEDAGRRAELADDGGRRRRPAGARRKSVGSEGHLPGRAGVQRPPLEAPGAAEYVEGGAEDVERRGDEEHRLPLHAHILHAHTRAAK